MTARKFVIAAVAALTLGSYAQAMEINAITPGPWEAGYIPGPWSEGYLEGYLDFCFENPDYCWGE